MIFDFGHFRFLLFNPVQLFYHMPKYIQFSKIAHVKLLLDDSVIMISDSIDDYAANKTMLHTYVPDVFKTFDLAISNGCERIETPLNKTGDPDTRGSFYDFAGNYWAVSTQKNV